MLKLLKAPLAALSLGMILLAAQPVQAATILETATFTGEDPGDYTVIGDGTNGNSRFIGARFSLSGETTLTDIAVGIGGFGAGTFFAAIVPLASLDAFPSTDPASIQSIALGSALLSAEGGPSVAGAALSLDLAAGDYAVIFGSGLFGASGYAPLTDGNTPIGDYSGLFESLYDSSWFDFNESGILVRIDGTPAAVPEPASWTLMIAGFGAVGASLRRRKLAVRFS